MEFKIDFGNALPPAPPPAHAPLHASIDGVAFPLGTDECVFRPRGGGEPHVMTVDVLTALDSTRAFRTLDEHAFDVARRLPQLAGRSAAVRPVLENLAARGLLVDDAGFLARLDGRSARATVAPFRALVVRTCDRPARLAALLETLAANEAAHRGGHRLVVIDDSRDADAVARNAEVVRSHAAAARIDARHIAPAGWARALERWRRAVPEAAPAIDGLLARDAAGQPRAGGGKAFNLALLLSAGARFAILDDDFLLPLRRHGARTGVAASIPIVRRPALSTARSRPRSTTAWPSTAIRWPPTSPGAATRSATSSPPIRRCAPPAPTCAASSRRVWVTCPVRRASSRPSTGTAATRAPPAATGCSCSARPSARTSAVTASTISRRWPGRTSCSPTTPSCSRSAASSRPSWSMPARCSRRRSPPAATRITSSAH